MGLFLLLASLNWDHLTRPQKLIKIPIINRTVTAPKAATPKRGAVTAPKVATPKAAQKPMQKKEPEPMEQEPSSKRPWERFDEDGNKIKRKKVPGAKNLRLRKHVQPRNAVMCLNELVPGAQYETEQEGGAGKPFIVSLTVEGVTYTGSAPSKTVARQNAAEAALVSFVKPPVSKEDDRDEDKTPWATLASFAMYKLFTDWKDGRIGIDHPQAGPTAPVDMREYLAVKGHFNQMQTVGGMQTTGIAAVASPVKNPAKQIPDNAASLHPTMVLHQMKPNVEYVTDKSMRDNKPYFKVSAKIAGRKFSGEGPNMKRVKALLAKNAIKALFGVQSVFEIPA